MSTYISWNVDPATGDYVMDSTGNPINNGDLKTAAYIRLKTPRNGWLYAPDTNFGSDLNVTKKHFSNDPSALEAIVQRALQPIADDGRASAIAVETVEATRSGSSMAVLITDASGIPTVLPLDQIGI